MMAMLPRFFQCAESLALRLPTRLMRYLSVASTNHHATSAVYPNSYPAGLIERHEKTCLSRQTRVSCVLQKHLVH